MSILSAKLSAVAVVWWPLMEAEEVLVRAGYVAGVTLYVSEGNAAVVAMLTTWLYRPNKTVTLKVETHSIALMRWGGFCHRLRR